MIPGMMVTVTLILFGQSNGTGVFPDAPNGVDRSAGHHDVEFRRDWRNRRFVALATDAIPLETREQGGIQPGR